MPVEAFNSLEDYEGFIRETIEPWPPVRRVALAAAMAQRWLPAYETFTTRESWGDPAILRQGLEAVWQTVQSGTSLSVDWHRLSSELSNVTPHMDDFDANEALCACVMVEYAIDCCVKTENQSPALMALLSGFEAVQPDLLTGDRVPARVWKRAAIRKEIDKQLRLIEQVSALPTLADASQTLRAFLTDPEIVGELRPRPKREFAGLSNQQAFEQYRRMVQADIKNAATRMDPRQYPQFAAQLYLSMWMGRYRRRKETIGGGYGTLADRRAANLLVARNRAGDLAEKGSPVWEPDLRSTLDRIYGNTLNGLDAATPEDPHGYGPSLRRLWVEARRRGDSDQEVWHSIEAWAYHQPPAWNATGRRKKKETSFSLATLKPYLERPLTWNTTNNLDVPWTTEVEGETWQVRLNDFPDERMYSLLIGGRVVGDFHDWPRMWQRD